MGLGFPAQQRIWIDAGTVGLVAQLDAAEIPFGSLPAWLWSAKTLARA
jgi:N-acetylmuramic acid 6-phosphate (MurNAc-6-P) etherase